MATSSIASADFSYQQECSTITSSKLRRDGNSLSSSFNLVCPFEGRREQVVTPIAQQSKPFIQLRASAEKYNPNARFRPQRSPAVPEAELNTSKLAQAFPGFSGVVEDVKPFSPNPFTAKPNGHKLKVPSRFPHLQPKVRDENDISIASETHSSPTRPGKKNTRFGSITMAKTRNGPQPHIFNAGPSLVEKAAAVSSSGAPKPMAVNAQGSLTSIPNSSTQPTLNLPQATNLTDIFSGIVRHPPPCTAQPTVRPRASRFASAVKIQTSVEPKADEVPVPVDERHLLASIDVLQNRVAGLEIEKQEVTTRRRSDSAVSIPDDVSNDSKGQTAAQHRLATEKIRLETSNRLLQGQKDLLIQNVDAAETGIRNITQERDLYQAQLSAAEKDFSRLQADMTTCEKQRTQALEQLAVAESKVDTLSQENILLLEENRRLKAQITLLTQDQPDNEDFNLKQSRIGSSDDSTDADGPLDMDTQSMMYQQARKKDQRQEQTHAQLPAHQDNQTTESSQNITYLSYPGDSSISRVRKTLEQERKARQQCRQFDTAGDAKFDNIDKHNYTAASASKAQARDCSVSSVIRHPKRNGDAHDDLTSSFIIPDITFNQQRMMDGQISPALAANARAYSETAHQNGGHGFTERSEILAYAPIDPIAQPSQHAGESIQLPAISDEELDLTIQDEEPTIHPIQPPHVALAVVMESLQAELVEQRAVLAKYQSNYNRHDVSVSRRQRKRIFEKIQSLLKSCEIKADQIYNLHDVLATHNGQPITQDQVDNTLQSLGLNVPFEGFPSESSTTTRRKSTVSSRSI